jgi:iron-sulfur cluster repair protein YtfE (RIC family)
MKATTLLQRQHTKVKAIFKKLEGGRSNAAPLLEQLANDLAAHMAIEQDIFYPAIKSIDEDLVRESFEEHSLAELALKRLLACDPKDPSFAAHVTATKELIMHHVKEEEEDMFPKVEKKLKEEKLNELGDAMKARFETVVAAGFQATVPKGFAKTSSDLSLSHL